jgi:hypothetical protein
MKINKTLIQTLCLLFIAQNACAVEEQSQFETKQKNQISNQTKQEIKDTINYVQSQSDNKLDQAGRWLKEDVIKIKKIFQSIKLAYQNLVASVNKHDEYAARLSNLLKGGHKEHKWEIYLDFQTEMKANDTIKSSIYDIMINIYNWNFNNFALFLGKTDPRTGKPLGETDATQFAKGMHNILAEEINFLIKMGMCYDTKLEGYKEKIDKFYCPIKIVRN